MGRCLRNLWQAVILIESDPRRFRTLAAAARNRDGTYDLARAVSWASEHISGDGHGGISVAEVRQILAEETARFAERK